MSKALEVTKAASEILSHSQIPSGSPLWQLTAMSRLNSLQPAEMTLVKTKVILTELLAKLKIKTIQPKDPIFAKDIEIAYKPYQNLSEKLPRLKELFSSIKVTQKK